MNNALLLKAALVTVLLSFSQITVASSFYKWVDKDGVTHYGAHPPQGEEQAASEVTKVRTTNKTPANAVEANQRLEAQREAQKAKTDDQKAAEADRKREEEEKAYAEQMKKNCEVSRKNVETLTNNARVREQGEDGEFRYLTPDEHQQRIDKAKSFMAEHCK